MRRTDDSYPGLIGIGDIIVSSDIVTEYFVCDYDICGGACCVIGDSGAPLDESELEELEKLYPVYSKTMSEEGQKVVSSVGFFEIDRDGDIVTPLIGNSEECAYCTRDEKGNCLCAIEKEYCRGQYTSFKKPLSCELYPIRVKQFPDGTKALNLHRWDICSCAFKLGREKGVRVYQFLKVPLTRAFGEEFYSALETAAKKIL